MNEGTYPGGDPHWHERACRQATEKEIEEVKRFMEKYRQNSGKTVAKWLDGTGKQWYN